jgi:hypothetical protein
VTSKVGIVWLSIIIDIQTIQIGGFVINNYWLIKNPADRACILLRILCKINIFTLRAVQGAYVPRKFVFIHICCRNYLIVDRNKLQT